MQRDFRAVFSPRPLWAALWALGGSAWASEQPTLSIPASQDQQSWAAIAEIAGVALVQSEADISVVEGEGEGWLVVVVDGSGERHEVAMPAPTDEASREEIVWLGRSLLTPVTAAFPAPEPPPPAPLVPPPLPVLPEPQPAPRYSRGLGLGLVVGEPIGASAKVILSRDRGHALDLAVGSPDLERRWSVYADYLWAPRMTSLGRADLFAHVGLGGLAEVKRRDGYATVENRPRGGARLPLGFDLWLPQPQIEGFAELACDLLVGPRAEMRLGGALGARYWF